MNAASLARGLAVRVDNQQMMDNERFIYQAEVQKDAQKKKEAWMLTEDIQFGKAFDTYNKQRLEQHTNSTMDQITQMVSDGDIMGNPEKLYKIKQLKQSLIDNEIVDESIRFMANKEMRMKFQADPRNAELLDEPEYLDSLKREKLYESTGSANGDINKKEEYGFTPPPVKINTAALIAESFSKLEQHGMSQWGAGIDGYRQFVTHGDRRAAAENLYNDASIAGKALRREWQSMDDKERKVYANNPVNWISERGKGYVPADKYHGGSIPKTTGPGGANNKGSMRDIWDDVATDPLLGAAGLKQTASGLMRIPGITPKANPKVTLSGLRGTAVGPKGDIDLSDAVVYDGNGNPLPVDFGFISSGASETGELMLRTVPGSDGLPYPNPQRPLEMGIRFDISVGEFVAKYNDQMGGVIDPDFFEGDIYEDTNDYDIEENNKYSSILRNAGYTNKNGDQMISITAWRPVSADQREMMNNTHGKKQNAQASYGPQEGEEYSEGGYDFIFSNGRWERK